MSNPYYDLYVKSVLTLARSLIIKDSETGRVIENQVTFGGLSQGSGGEANWRYYQNLAGNYHFRDEPMVIRSIDTLEDIVFSKEELEVHRATALEYQFGSRYYEQLVARYPEQETLIRGIVQPVDINKALEAEDGTILGFDHNQVEFNETNLIPKLQSWIKRFYVRWNISGYGLVDELYAPAFLGVLYSLIPQVIFNIRLENCKTNYVHSYHVRQYLASHGQLDLYMDQLNTKQALWLYRNIDYLMRNAGKEETFSTLMQHILTERGIALATYEARHNLASISETLKPKPEMSLRFLNANVGDDYRDIRPTTEILDKEIPVAPQNAEENDLAYEYVPRRLSLSMTDSEPTKVLESIVSDNSNNVAFSFEQLLFNHWIYLACNDRYTANVSFAHPATGEAVTLTAKETFISYFYVLNKVYGYTFDAIPELTVPWIKRQSLPTLEELKALVNSDYVDDSDLQRSLEGHPPMGVYVTVADFRDYCLKLRDLLSCHREIYILKEHMKTRGQLEGALMAHWQETVCNFEMPQGYDQWFLDRGLDFHLLEDTELRVLSESLIEAGTGTDLSDANALRSLQDAMVGIMERLSSYSVQYLKTISSNTFFHAEWASARIGDVAEKGYAQSTHRHSRYTTVDLRVKGKDSINSRIGNYNNFKVIPGVNPERVFMEVMPEHRFEEMTYAKLRIPTSSIGVIGFNAQERE